MGTPQWVPLPQWAPSLSDPLIVAPSSGNPHSGHPLAVPPRSGHLLAVGTPVVAPPSSVSASELVTVISVASKMSATVSVRPVGYKVPHEGSENLWGCGDQGLKRWTPTAAPLQTRKVDASRCLPLQNPGKRPPPPPCILVRWTPLLTVPTPHPQLHHRTADPQC